MRFERGDLRVEVLEAPEAVLIWRETDDYSAALRLDADELAWLMWGAGSAALALFRKNQRGPVAAAHEPATGDGTDLPDGQWTVDK